MGFRKQEKSNKIPIMSKNYVKNNGVVFLKKAKKRKFSLSFFARGSGVDMPFLLLVLSLVTIGLIMMFSASYPNAYYLHHQNSFFFIRNQAIFAAFGLVSMFFMSKFNYENFRSLSKLLVIISFVLLSLVLVMPPINGVRRWFQLGPIGFQASEVTKFALTTIFAYLIDKNFDKMNSIKYGILPFSMILIPTIILLALEPHISCSVIITLLAGCLLFIGGVKLRWFLIVLGIIAAGVLYLVLFTDRLTYANHRISGWLDPFNAPEGVDTWQTRQGLYAIGSGKIFGLGLGNSKQKFLYIPEPQNDFIFAVVCEELGLFGALIILIIFASLIWRGIIIAIKAKNRFASVLCAGLILQVGLQTILNIAVVTNTIPNTGISLPFFSYGGTSLLMLLTQMGIILSISRDAKIEKS
ncbi:MAG: FtsW/RodA/SpoVE family cell cycle protein [Candidatus Improbicoccus pseudotrichonymphae]|uniref:Probable peptidoglycan glycosyltransferase FtsW n=1 Tax=Candidatus Improbicoccus pseudotrichonymphae TaxID=3033792 RepID=A0AA48KZH3_9FIRM|nr:MAG: FtsW/RodA/SpoVE family cell cycle protein [Candidatus Improbicoccus pseudotrichonymphae]